MLDRGVALAPGAYEIFFTSLAHTVEDLERTVSIAADAAKEVLGDNIRSEDWTVRPSFVPNGPTSPVVLLTDDTGLTQLAGIPAVAWQTPWSEITNLELVRLHHQMALFATVGGVRYCWRNREITDYEQVRPSCSNTAASSRSAADARASSRSSRSCRRELRGRHRGLVQPAKHWR